LRVGNDKLTISSPVAGGKPFITLSNKDNVSVEANVLETDKKVEIKIGGKVLGWVYTVSNVPVAKFIDGSIKAL